MEQCYNNKMAELGYNQLVCDIFLDWENVKDELLIPDRKSGTGNGTIHVFLGAADSELKKEFASYYESVASGEDTSVGAIEVKHYFMISNVLSVLGYVCHYLREKKKDFVSFFNNTLDYIDDIADESGLLSTTSYFKLSTGSNKLRPYFKQFESKGVFSDLIRQILLPNSSYKISLYKNDEGEYAAFWLIGFDWQSSFDADSSVKNLNKPSKKLFSLQQIFYGAPGTGKSHKVDELCNQFIHYRTTFHPDSDYSSFVGCYKPQTLCGERIYDKLELINKLNSIKNSGVTYPCQKFATKYWQSLKRLSPDEIKNVLTECQFTDSMSSELLKGIGIGEELMPDQYNSKIVYRYSPQVFINAYVEAWKKQEEGEKVFLVIEEINRGNCAQIFGDLFQLLDRDEKGFSKYEIVPDSDIVQFLNTQSLNAKDVKDSYGNDISMAINSGNLMKLPPNLYIWATMNTSDQSLFPIDSAFKRRWDWEYVPIKYSNIDWKIVLGDKKYSWVSFQEKINDKIKDATDGSEDKQMGDFFVNVNHKRCIIDSDLLLNKIVFYLWNDVCKEGEGDIFKLKNGDKTEDISFSQFFKEDSILKLQQWMDYLKVDPYSDPNNNVSV